MRYKLYNRYSIYYRVGEMPLIIHGTAQECANAMGIALGTFYSYLSRQNAGKQELTKYLIYEDGKETEEVVVKKKELPEHFKQIIIALAENDMRPSRAAKQYGISVGGMYYNMRLIQEDTGKDPQKFYDLCELLEMARGAKENGTAEN